MNDLQMIEKLAIDMALGNNGGSWATHYTETQKELWRGRAVKLISECYDMLKSRDALAAERKPAAP